MNPPSALYGAMSKERKPFTYTPGGLDLSEIKSERMAARLMRNAMSQGVPETPAQTLHLPPAPVNPNALPNFNCLPVQVFPTFQLPANPKSLLRTRSNPSPKEPSLPYTPQSNTLSSGCKPDVSLVVNSSNACSNNNTNNNRPSSMYDHTLLNSSPIYQPTKYGSSGHTELLSPEKFYDAESYGGVNVIEANKDIFKDKPTLDVSNTITLVKNDYDNNRIPVTLATSLQDTDTTNDYEQKEVKVSTKQSESEKKTDHNGDTEAAVVIKLPAKSSSAKTETKVEISKNILPDGTIEEVKTTITKTTIDGKTEITTETETRTIPKEALEDEEEEEEVVEEEEEEGEIIKDNKKQHVNEISETNGSDEVAEEVVIKNIKTDTKPNGHIITGEEKVETSTTKKVVVVQSTQDESEEEIEEEVEEEAEEEEEDGDVEVEEVVILRKSENKLGEDNNNIKNSENVKNVEETINLTKEDKPDEQEEEDVEYEDNKVEIDSVKEELKQEIENNDIEEGEKEKEQLEEKDEPEKNIDEDVEEEYEEAEDKEIKEEVPQKASEEVAEEVEEDTVDQDIINAKDKTEQEENNNQEDSLHTEELVERPEVKEEDVKQEVKEEIVHEIKVQSEPKVSLREPSIPLEKVEDVEIKPIIPAQEVIKKLHTEIITTTTDKPTGALSTQTEYKQIENIVTVNRTTKTLDHAYEQSQQSMPTLKTYFSPSDDRNLSTPQPMSRPYQPVYPPESQTERRHSLLLDRLSVDRQVNAPDIYQNNYQYSNQNYEQNQWIEPQSEVLTVSNVKPSTITKNQQWYQQTSRENTTSSIPSSVPTLPSQQLGQSYMQHQPQIQIQQPEPQYQSYVQPQYTSKPEFKPYVESNTQNTYKSANDLQQNTYSNYTSKPSWASNTFESKPVNLASPIQTNHYSTLKESTENSYNTSQLSSSYVPPPWEQDSSYVTENQNYYQPAPSATSFSPSTNQTWKPKPASKFSKNTSTSYIPPAPNQSFVKPVTASDHSKLPGRKTYYSEYERRYISVPESTYIPSETKFQVQPDPSPQYYYDNNEPAEIIEPQWRKELREFTEKTSEISTQYEKTSVRPPWEEDPKYAAPTEYTATVTPSWTQTLRPRTWRERSYEPEYIGSKTNTLGRGRPQSSYVKGNVDTIQERPRGVSVDRYNPNHYQPPLASEHPPVQSHTLNPNIHPKTYHNPNVPVYHSRASVEPREQVSYPQSRPRVESRAPPVQSRSFKYLQWITGTED